MILHNLKVNARTSLVAAEAWLIAQFKRGKFTVPGPAGQPAWQPLAAGAAGAPFPAPPSHPLHSTPARRAVLASPKPGLEQPLELVSQPPLCRTLSVVQILDSTALQGSVLQEAEEGKPTIGSPGCALNAQGYTCMLG